ncbi:MAG: hypothetical protein ACK4N5_22345, partial [Myxococcales bacterium]
MPLRGAQSAVRRFKGSILALALTALLLMVVAPEADAQVDRAADAAAQVVEAGTPRAAAPGNVVEETGAQARETFEGLWASFVPNVPRYLIAALIVFGAWLVTRLGRPVVRLAARSWQGASAVGALLGIAVWIL